MKTIVIPLFADTTLQALRDRFGDVLGGKSVLIIACFNLSSLFFPKGCRVPPGTTEKIRRKKSPLE
jgi:hypothetical protein